jgi:gluconolactonase
MPELSLSAFRTYADGLDHSEGVATGPDGLIYAGGEAGQVYRVQSSGMVEMLASTDGFILGLCLDAASNVYACDLKKKAVYRVSPSGEVSVYSQGTSTRPMMTPNFPVFDAAGRLFVADSGNWHGQNGCLFCIHPSGLTEVASSQFKEFPNGLAISPDGSELYVALSNTPGVAKGKILADGTIGPPQFVVATPRVIPDGLAFDEAGNLYIACYTPDVIYRYSPQGELTVFAEDWESTILSSPTNIAFTGQDRRTMVVASLSRWHLAAAQVRVAGCAPYFPVLTNT